MAHEEVFSTEMLIHSLHVNAAEEGDEEAAIAIRATSFLRESVSVSPRTIRVEIKEIPADIQRTIEASIKIRNARRPNPSKQE